MKLWGTWLSGFRTCPPSHVTTCIIIIRIQINVHVPAVTSFHGNLDAKASWFKGPDTFNINASGHSTSDERETLETNEARYLRAE